MLLDGLLMPKQLLVYKCLLITPSDLEDVRSALTDTFTQWNAHMGNALNVRIEPAHWKSHTHPDISTSPQVAINSQLVDDCDFGLAFFWSRIGTKTSNHESGSVEEVYRLKSSGKPVLVYFSEEPIPQVSLINEQYARLSKLREKFQSEGLFHTYRSPEHLKQQLLLHVVSVVSRLALRDQGDEAPLINPKSSLTIAREFRHNRIDAVKRNRLPAGLGPKLTHPQKAVIHLFSLTDEETHHKLSVAQRASPVFRPMSSTGGWDQTYDRDGFINYNHLASYSHIGKNGGIECFDPTLLVPRSDDQGLKMIGSQYVEHHLIDRLADYMRDLKNAGIALPVLCSITFFGINGCVLVTSSDSFRFYFQKLYRPFDEPEILLPEFLIESYEQDASTLLKSSFDELWQIAGHERCFHFSPDGKYQRQR